MTELYTSNFECHGRQLVSFGSDNVSVPGGHTTWNTILDIDAALAFVAKLNATIASAMAAQTTSTETPATGVEE
jgi:hypothetical protein